MVLIGTWEVYKSSGSRWIDWTCWTRGVDMLGGCAALQLGKYCVRIR